MSVVVRGSWWWWCRRRDSSTFTGRYHCRPAQIVPASYAHSASADPRGQRTSFEGLGTGFLEHGVVFDGCKPVGKGRREVVASAVAVALDEGFRAEFFET